MTSNPVYCFRCNEVLVNYDDSKGEFYIGSLGHECRDGSYAITKIHKWFKDGRDVRDETKDDI